MICTHGSKNIDTNMNFVYYLFLIKNANEKKILEPVVYRHHNMQIIRFFYK